jgi:hypothetical protein
MQKDNITCSTNIITVNSSVATLDTTHDYTIELDFGEQLSGLAKQGSNTSATLSDTQGAVKNGTTTALAELLNNTYGLAALQTLIGTITGYALQGSDATATNTAIKNAIANIDLSAVAKQGSDATATLTAVASAIATLATAVSAIPTTTPATPTDVSNAQTAIIGAMPSVLGLASETSVKSGNDTAISMLKDGSVGLAAIKALVQAISGYALQGSDPTATNTAMNTLIGTPAVGQQPTLFKAIAAISGGGGGGGGDVQISAADWTALITAVNQLTGSELVYSDTAQDVIDEITALRNGVTFANIAKWWSLPLLLANRNEFVTGISSTDVSTVGAYAFYGSHLTTFNFPNLTTVGDYAFYGVPIAEITYPQLTSVGTSAFNSTSYCTKVYLPELITLGTSSFRSCAAEWLYVPKVSVLAGEQFNDMRNLIAVTCLYYTVTNQHQYCSKLYYIHQTGTHPDTNHNMSSWNPTEGFSTTLNTLVPLHDWDLDANGDPIDCSQFTTNAQKALWCFKNLFMPAFPQASNTKTLTLKSTVYDVVTTDQDVLDYFSLHNWTLARTA